MKTRTATLFAGAAVIAIVALNAALSAQRPPARDPVMRIWNGVYAEAQAERGKATFALACSNCHKADLSAGATGTPALAGPAFMAKWELQTVDQLFQIVKQQVPRGPAGPLADPAVIDMVAFILKSNGFPAAAAPGTTLSTDTDELEIIFVVPQTGPTKIPNFALVQVGGCLTARADRGWTLAQASEPASTKDVPATEADLQSTRARLPGAAAFRLVSAGPFDPNQHVGERVFVKGIINRNPKEALLNVTALQPMGERCTN